MGANRRPTLQRGLIAWGRVGAHSVNANAFRLLNRRELKTGGRRGVNGTRVGLSAIRLGTEGQPTLFHLSQRVGLRTRRPAITRPEATPGNPGEGA